MGRKREQKVLMLLLLLSKQFTVIKTFVLTAGKVSLSMEEEEERREVSSHQK